MKVLICRHSSNADPGLLADALSHHSLGYQYHDPFCSLAAAPPHDALVVLGGSQSANDPFDYIRREVGLVESALRAGKPILGICLGAQLLAQALGARVSRNPNLEIGWIPVLATPAAAGDPLFRGLSTCAFFHWHAETFKLPGGAVHLASSESCDNQAFRYGQNVWGIQFHPEATPSIIRQWLVEDACSQPEAAPPPDPESGFAAARGPATGILRGWCEIVVNR